jgi:hypothetical protein
MREVSRSKVEAALHMLHCRIEAATLSPSSHALKAGDLAKLACVPRLEWL